MFNIFHPGRVRIKNFKIKMQNQKEEHRDDEKDDYLRIVDYLPGGRTDIPYHKRKPTALGVGEKYFSLLEVVPREDASFESGERVYVGSETRKKVDYIERKIRYAQLTVTARIELPDIIEEIVTDNEKYFIGFYNTAEKKALSCLQRISKKQVDEIMDERHRQPFESFEDLIMAVKSLPDPAKVLSHEITRELKGESKNHLFVPAVKEEQSGGRREKKRKKPPKRSLEEREERTKS